MTEKKSKILENSSENQSEGIQNVAEFSDWEKIDLRVAEIIDVQEIENADKLWKLTLDVGELGERTICAGIKQFYSKDELKGIESQGMLLAASNEDHSKVVLIAPESDIETGSRIG